MQPFGTGAHESPFDNRTWTHDTTMATPLVSGGNRYMPEDIEHQHRVGICTAISMTQNAGKALGKKFSADFQYLLQKKYIDLNWMEGSSVFSALKVGKTYGFLPAELFTYVTEQDRYLSYDVYIEKLKAVPLSEILRLLALCTDKLSGYAQLPLDPYSLAKGILDSKAGILARYSLGSEWWLPTHDPKDIDPLKSPKFVISGHAVTKSRFDFSKDERFEIANSWGTDWCDVGNAHAVFPEYHCTEAWIPYYDQVPTPAPQKFVFTQDMKFGDRSEDVKQLQKRLGVNQTGFYGDLTKAAVLNFQLNNGIQLSFFERYILAGKICGGKTRLKLNL